ncbi:molybdopterin converting factor subunit 1 [Mesobacillus foraminis]|jgi:molybdopterin synthase sulfur carrier subunit|uniref:Molybdopterin synthase sulfur carrier subunit n=1 Tax=Mesobacillus foraminis TaxID=279826 RepID=A0A4R2BAP7_9BACI|nr:molybdopterin converting factor subunit 1 [Mesobacillus foraminis]MBT2756552.1 molybdopterin converting factor subunit 1 [Mesobacillus foraminis]TCN24001.1 molybdopterin synthase sulfur carrier subunit [Mesobacillus foraminis]
MNKILFFAHLRDEAGEESISLDAEGKTVEELKQMVAEQYQMKRLDSVMTAINEEFAPGDEVIKAGDVIAFIPPVSGG